MKSFISIISIGLVAALFSGCMAIGPKPIPFKSISKVSEDKASVYLVRPSQGGFGGAITFYTYVVDEKETFLATVPRNTFSEHKFKAGKLHILIDTEFDTNVKMDLEAGKVYCVDIGAIPGIFVANASANEYEGIQKCTEIMQGTNLHITRKDYIQHKDFIHDCKLQNIMKDTEEDDVSPVSCEDKYKKKYNTIL